MVRRMWIHPGAVVGDVHRDGALAVTNAAAFSLVREGLVNPARLGVLPNPIDPAEVRAFLAERLAG